MKRVLIIAYMFPPLGGGGVQRTLKFVKYLPDYGWKPLVIAGINDYYTKDPSLKKEIPEEAEVERIRAFEFLNFYHKLERLGLHKLASAFDKITSIPDGKFIWGKRVLSRVQESKERFEAIDAIYATGPPFTNFRVGKALKENLGDPLILDYRDEWTSSPLYKSNLFSRLKKPIEKRMENNCVRAADILICLNNGMKNQLLSRQESLTPGKIYTIPNGFDKTDFKGLGHSNGSLLQEDDFNIVYTGSFYGKRNPRNFFAALETIMDENAKVRKRVQIHLIGNVETPYVRKITEGESRLSQAINLHGYLAHRESTRYLKEADVLLLIIGRTEGSERIFTGKLFEYLAVKKPILGIVPPTGAAANVMHETKSGVVANHAEVGDIKAKIKDLYEGWKKDFKNFQPDEEAISNYEREKLTEKLAKVLDELV